MLVRGPLIGALWAYPTLLLELFYTRARTAACGLGRNRTAFFLYLLALRRGQFHVYLLGVG